MSFLLESTLANPDSTGFVDVACELTYRQTEASGKRGPEKLSHHVHRIGYDFASEVVVEACQQLDYKQMLEHETTNGVFLSKHQRRQAEMISSTAARQGLRFDIMRGLENEEYRRDVIRELYPKIPDEEVDTIIAHAWREGANRVGTSNCSLAHRVQFAVLAGIRHRWTDYEALLKAGFADWVDIRLEVEPYCLAKLLDWAGVDDDDNNARMEPYDREVLVISDESNGEGSTDESGDTSDASSEFVEQSREEYKKQIRTARGLWRNGILQHDPSSPPPPGPIPPPPPTDTFPHDLVTINGRLHQRVRLQSSCAHTLA